jgi:hypothetical protein
MDNVAAKCDIKRCYVEGSLNGDNRLSGFIPLGRNQTYIEQCVSKITNASLPNGGYIGRIVGQANGFPMNISANFGIHNFTSSSLSLVVAKNGTTISEEQATSQAFYESIGWDFDNVWKMVDGRPKFK